MKKNELKYPLSFIFPGIFFLSCFLYFFFLNRFIILFQEQLQLFRFSKEYFVSFLSRPGGIAEYIGAFFTQFFINPFLGALILTISGILVTLLCIPLFRKYEVKGLIWSILPVFLLVSLQSDYMFAFGNTIAFLLAIGSFNLWLLIKNHLFKYAFLIILWPLLYLATGVFAFFASFLCLFHELITTKGSQRFGLAGLILLIAFAAPWLFGLTIYYIPAKEIWINPSLLVFRKVTQYALYLLVLYLPVALLIARISMNGKSFLFTPKWDLKNILAGGLLMGLMTTGVVKYVYDPQIRKFLEMDHQVQQQNWSKVLKISAKAGGTNRLMLYYTNLALFKTGQMGNHMFQFNQIGIPGLWLSREGNPISLFLGGELFYHLGNINEATRWAYDAMVNNGQHSPRLLKQLILGALINEDYRSAAKYLRIFDQTLFYKNWAKRYKDLVSHPDILSQDKEIAEKRHLLIQNDFVAQINDSDIALEKLLQEHPDNRMAFEYYMSSLLLSKKLDAFVENIGRLKDFGYKEIPLHYEEALIFYMGYKKQNVVPEGFGIHKATYERFQEYARAFGSQPRNSSAADHLYPVFGNTYWYYLHFINNQTSANATHHPFN